MSVNDETYMVFYEIELQFRRMFHITTTEILKKSFAVKVLANEEVLFYWALVSINWDESTCTELLKEIADYWVTIRGFSSASSFLELYKKLARAHFKSLRAFEKPYIQLIHHIMNKTNKLHV